MNPNSNTLSMGFPGDLVRSLFYQGSASFQTANSMTPTDIPEENRDNVIANPTIVLTSTSPKTVSKIHDPVSSELSMIDINSNEKQQISSSSKTANRKISIISVDSDSSSIDGLTVPRVYMKSNSMPDRMPVEQRPSVMGRISKQATNHLNSLYYRSVSVESQHSLCGCYFWRKRQRYDSYNMPMDENDAATMSNILTRYHSSNRRGRDRADTNVSMEFRNTNFNPSDDENASVDQIPSALKAENKPCNKTGICSIANNKENHILKNNHRTTKAVSKYRTGNLLSGIVSDVIIEEQYEEEEEPVSSLNKNGATVKPLQTIVVATMMKLTEGRPRFGEHQDVEPPSLENKTCSVGQSPPPPLPHYSSRNTESSLGSVISSRKSGDSETLLTSTNTESHSENINCSKKWFETENTHPSRDSRNKKTILGNIARSGESIDSECTYKAMDSPSPPSSCCQQLLATREDRFSTDSLRPLLSRAISDSQLIQANSDSNSCNFEVENFDRVVVQQQREIGDDFKFDKQFGRTFNNEILPSSSRIFGVVGNSSSVLERQKVLRKRSRLKRRRSKSFSSIEDLILLGGLKQIL